MTQPTISEVLGLLKAMLESDSLMGRIADQQVEDGWVLITRLEQHGIAPPDGYVIVPSEPTKEMIHEVEHATRLGAVWTAYAVYKAMLTAAPKPEVKP